MARKVQTEALLNWLDWLARCYRSGDNITSLTELHRLAKEAGIKVPSLQYLRRVDLSDRLPPETLAWYDGVRSPARSRVVSWQRALLDLHYYMVLVAQGDRSQWFVANHGDTYATKLSIALNSGVPQSQVEWSERQRVVGSDYWQSLDLYGYPTWVSDDPERQPVCRAGGRCLLETYLNSEAGHIDLMVVSMARHILDQAVGDILPWLPTATPTITTEMNYQQALDAYLGLGESYVSDNH